MGGKWNYQRKGSENKCGNWSASYEANIKEGPDTNININYNNSNIKTLLVEQTGIGRSDRCGTFEHKIVILYSPELDEIILNKITVFDTDNGSRLLESGSSLLLRALKTD